MNSEMKIKLSWQPFSSSQHCWAFNGLISAVQKTDRGANHTSSVWQQELTLHAEKIRKA